MSEESSARRARLKKIAAGGRLKFRNYKPEDAELSSKAVEIALPTPILDEVAAKTATRAASDDNDGPESKKSKQDDAPETAIQRELRSHNEENGGTELLNIAPRKPNWDLKRDVAKKMEKLQRRTQLAIVELIKERIAKEAAEEAGSGDEESD
mmetsp:Transcript_9681/g.19012  ORF Transcript_9681/g.19012 Transcript_9681/m.19012 type:complete len:153 (+) Transcript_9681:65-523(+)